MNPEVSKGNMIAFNDSDYVSKINSSFTVSKNLTQVVATYEVKVRTIGREYDFVFNKGKFDLCNVQRGVLGSVFIKYLNEHMTSDVTNMRLVCPFLAQDYYVHGFPIIGIKFTPRGLSSKTDFQFTSNIRVKFNGSKGLVNFGSIKTTGTVQF
jgi:hypothetical protein